MSPIPVRENLETMSRSDIQKLCKDNNIKANMRTDEMINALCDLVNGHDVPRPHRAASHAPKSRVPSAHSTAPTPAPIPAPPTKKAALQPSESNTDAESATDVPVHSTRRRAKDIQTHLGKGRPVAAGGSGARNVTKVLSRGRRGTKASAMLHEEPIPEEEEGHAPAEKTTDNNHAEKAARPISPAQKGPSSPPDGPPSQLPTPAPSQPSYSLPSAQLSALEARLAHLEAPNLATRIQALEASLAELTALKTLAAQIPTLQSEVRRLDADAERSAKAYGELQARVQELVEERAELRERVAELEKAQRDRRDASMSSVIIHSSPSQRTRTAQDDQAEVAAETHANVPVKPQPALADPSPSRPTLGKRARVDTPDVSDADGEGQPLREDVELEAIHRVTRPQKKRARLTRDEDEDGLAFFARVPSSTSTPRHQPPPPVSTSHPQPSHSPPGFFTAGRRAPTPLARTDADADEMAAYLHLEPDDPPADESLAMATAGPAPARPASTPHTPPPRIPSAALHDPNFFGGPLPVIYTHDSELPYPLQPTTPPNPQDILDRSAQFATPVLGEPWRYHASLNPANVSQLVESLAHPTASANASQLAESLARPTASTSAASGAWTMRAGGRRERNDKYNPYFTPQRGPGARLRTGLTPSRGFSLALKSPAVMASVAEDADTGAVQGEDADAGTGAGAGAGVGTDEVLEEDGLERSPPQLRTLYGTELEGDTRFGDYGRDLGKFDWAKYVPR